METKEKVSIRRVIDDFRNAINHEGLFTLDGAREFIKNYELEYTISDQLTLWFYGEILEEHKNILYKFNQDEYGIVIKDSVLIKIDTVNNDYSVVDLGKKEVCVTESDYRATPLILTIESLLKPLDRVEITKMALDKVYKTQEQEQEKGEKKAC